MNPEILVAVLGEPVEAQENVGGGTAVMVDSSASVTSGSSRRPLIAASSWKGVWLFLLVFRLQLDPALFGK